MRVNNFICVFLSPLLCVGGGKEVILLLFNFIIFMLVNYESPSLLLSVLCRSWRVRQKHNCETNEVRAPLYKYASIYTVEPPNNGHFGDEHFVHCSEVVPSSEVEMYG